MMDDSLLIFEPPIRNSGIVGGKFLERQRVYKPESEEIYTFQVSHGPQCWLASHSKRLAEALQGVPATADSASCIDIRLGCAKPWPSQQGRIVARREYS